MKKKKITQVFERAVNPSSNAFFKVNCKYILRNTGRILSDTFGLIFQKVEYPSQTYLNIVLGIVPMSAIIECSIQ